MGKQYGAIELGGTSIRVILADEKGKILSRDSFETQEADTTIQNIINFYQAVQSKLHTRIQSLGVACFGPLDLRPDSKTYGFITSTPKPGWAFFNIKQELENGLDVAVAMDTDVNAAALGEFSSLPSNLNIHNLAYVTVGTGIGAGLIINNELTHGLVHPEFGHIFIPHNSERDPFAGNCPYHRDCLEGLASGPAIQERWNQKPKSLPADHIAWQLEGEYLAYAAVNLIFTVSPEMIIFGGGVMGQKHLYQFIREKTKYLLNEYIHSESVFGTMKKYICPPKLGEDSALVGALQLAKLKGD